jgi:hypothetical protein
MVSIAALLTNPIVAVVLGAVSPKITSAIKSVATTGLASLAVHGVSTKGAVDPGTAIEAVGALVSFGLQIAGNAAPVLAAKLANAKKDAVIISPSLGAIVDHPRVVSDASQVNGILPEGHSPAQV